MLSAVILGEHVATRAIREHERLIGNDLVASVDSVLVSASARSHANVEALAGLPCSEVERNLAELETHLRYIRAVALAENGRVYCSSALGSIDVPLSAYLKPGHSPQSIALLAQTPFQPGIPVLVLLNPASGNSGVLYVIEGDYLADVLVHGIRYGAQSAVLTIEGSGALDEQGRFHSGGVIDAVHPTEVTSKAWPFAIQVTSSPGLVARKRWGYALAFGAVGLLVDGLIAALYLLAFAPRRLLLAAVRHGLRRGEFHVVYQPVVAVKSRSVVGVEVLLRWHHAKWGPISPAAFMDEVESSNMLAEVTRFVLQTVLADMKAYPPSSPLRIAINVAPRDLERKGFVDEVVVAVKTLRPHVNLMRELTERFLLSDGARTSATFAALKAEGVKFAIDDFGTQHSNLDLLRRFPFDYVKIDRQFVNQVDTGGAGLISGIVALARHFGLEVIAEGVETQSQHDGLLEVGVPYAQGYLYQRPVVASMLAASIHPSTAMAND
ncbi:EAL domain-containing protein [Paraburkholderia hospita]|uniref:EAL domain-containing protein n=1 Tax=Paraburkholderia hospita TaxID=169430 RepID=UPI001F1FACCF|nr:EAL domain-containing protein [Paraburkholderia hospita]